jgi:N-acyl homoserine lactone hydrolase
MNAPATQPTITVGGFSIDILVQGFPGKTVCHGGLGWSTVALVRGQGRVVLIDAGNFGMRRLIAARLEAHGLAPSDVTDVILTHAHYDHSINWPMFSSSRILIGKQELEWAVAQPLGHHTIPEFYVRELAISQQLHNVEVAEEVIPGLTAYAGPGHTPGHLVYVLNGGERDVIFSGDAAKNRAEMLSREADMTMNAGDSRRTMERIWDLWRKKPGSILVPGHDVPMRLEDDEPVYIAKRTAGISAWFGRRLEETTLIELKV